MTLAPRRSGPRSAAERRSILAFVTTGVIFGSVLAAWLRFDAGRPGTSVAVVLMCLAAVVAGSILQARRVPHLQLPRKVQELSTREELTAEEEVQYAAALRAWHQDQQRDAWRTLAREGPGRQIRRRATLYFLWLSLFVLMLWPLRAVPTTFLPQLPRFAIVLVPLAAAAVTIAIPLGIRDWRRAKKALTTESHLI